MKYFICFTLALSSMFTSAQDLVGTYELQSNSKASKDFKLERTLTINTDGTFEYYNYRYIENGIPKETKMYGKGTWKKDKKVITFTTASTELDDKFTLNFSGTKARFISKSPRDSSDRIIETSIRFYESEIFWIKGMTLVKK